MRRADNQNAAFGRVELRSYFANLTEALDVVRDNTEPGPLRDRLYRRWYRIEMLDRIRGRKLLARSPAERHERMTEIRRIAAEYFDPGVARGLPPSQRVLGGLVQAGLGKDLLRLADWEKDVAAAVRLDELGWRAGALHLALTAELRVGRKPVTYAHRDGRDLLVLPCLTRAGRKAIPDADLDATARLRQSKVDILVRSRENSAEHYLPVAFTASRRPLDGATATFRHLLHGEARLDVATLAGGAGLADGIWDVVVRVSSCGWSKDVRLGATRVPSTSDQCVPAVVGDPTRVATPYWTDQGNLSLDLGQRTSRLGRNGLMADLPEIADADGALSISVPLRLAAPGPLSDGAVRLLHAASGERVCLPAELTPTAPVQDVPRSNVRATHPGALAPGRWSVDVRLAAAGAARFVRLPAAVRVPGDHGAPVVTPVDRPRAAPSDGSDGVAEPRPPRSRPRAIRLGRRFAGRVVRKVRATLGNRAR